MKFTSSVAGQITALKFYRSAGDTGPDLLDLWSSTGTKLASATFTNTAASGWQTVTLATPVIDHRQHDLYRVLPHDRRLCGDRQFLHHRLHQRSADSTLHHHVPAATASMPTAAPTPPASSRPTPSVPPTTGPMWCSPPVGRRRNTPPTAVADTADATEKGGVANGSGGSPATGNVLTNDTDPDAGRHQDRHRGQLRCGGRHAWHRARRSAWQPRAQRLGGLHLHRQRDGCRRAGLAAIDQYADRCLQLHHARYGRRHIHDDAHRHHSRRRRRAGACGPDRQPECDRRLGLLAGAARRHLHRRRYRRQPCLHGDRRRRLVTSRLADASMPRPAHSAARRRPEMSARSASRSRPPISAASRQARHSISS